MSEEQGNQALPGPTGDTPSPESNDASGTVGSSVQTKVLSWLDASFILAILTVFIYLAGRIYTEQYYGQFSVNYRSLDFSTATYMFNGWNVVSTALVVLILLTLLFLLGRGKAEQQTGRARNLEYKLTKDNVLGTFIGAIVTAAFLIAVIIAPAWYISIRLNRDLPWDISVQVASFIIIAILVCCTLVKIEEGSKKIHESMQLKRTTLTVFIVTGLLTFWFCLFFATGLLARYHAERAKNGRMGVTVAQLHEGSTTSKNNSSDAAKNCWWLLLTRTDDGRVLLYQQNIGESLGESIFVPDKAIALTRDYRAVKEKYNCPVPLR